MWGQVKTKATDYQYGLSLQPKVRVGIVDTGILSTHADLASNMWKNPKEIAGNNIDDDGNGYVDDVMGYNFIANSGNALDDQGHGTHVAGIIGSSINGAGSFGTNSNASLVALKVLDSTGVGSSYDIAEAINYAANNGIPVINLSLGGTGNPANDMICSAIASARLKGTLSIVAAGNENADVSTKVPAGCKDALTVGAVDVNLSKASFSNYGAEVDVSAPGVNIYSTYNNGGYVLMSGTSMATPFVAGLAASIKAYKPNFGPNDLFAVIKNDTTTVPVTSAVNIGRFVLMNGEMSNIGVLNDAQIPTGGTGSGSTGS
jgi:subtilisin family serine protease